jgi:polar amino acid transport system substrate-binding protein
MSKWKRGLCALLMMWMVLPLTACGDTGGGYRIIDTYSAEGSYVIAFRQGDKICDLVTAAMKELAANGTLRAASQSWFGENLVSVKAESGAMDDLWSEVTSRTITVGVDITNMPMSYESNGSYMGFDVDVANYICGYLGWSMVIYPIDPDNVEVELNSGNIDMAMGIPMSEQTDDFSYSPSYLTSRYVLVARVTGRVRDKSALKGKTLGVVITDLDVLQQDEKFVSSLGAITYQTNTDGLFQALVNDEVDGILVSSVVAAYYMK